MGGAYKVKSKDGVHNGRETPGTAMTRVYHKDDHKYMTLPVFHPPTDTRLTVMPARPFMPSVNDNRVPLPSPFIPFNPSETPSSGSISLKQPWNLKSSCSSPQIPNTLTLPHASYLTHTPRPKRSPTLKKTYDVSAKSAMNTQDLNFGIDSNKKELRTDIADPCPEKTPLDILASVDESSHSVSSKQCSKQLPRPSFPFLMLSTTRNMSELLPKLVNPNASKANLTTSNVIDVGRDGNCYFRCLSLWLHGTEEFHSIHRQIIVRELDSNRETYRHLFNSNQWENMSRYIGAMSKTDGLTSSYATDIEIYITSKLYHMDIFVSTPDLGIQGFSMYSYTSEGMNLVCDHMNRSYMAIQNARDHYKLVVNQRPCNCETATVMTNPTLNTASLIVALARNLPSLHSTGIGSEIQSPLMSPLISPTETHPSTSHATISSRVTAAQNLHMASKQGQSKSSFPSIKPTVQKSDLALKHIQSSISSKSSEQVNQVAKQSQPLASIEPTARKSDSSTKPHQSNNLPKLSEQAISVEQERGQQGQAKVKALGKIKVIYTNADGIAGKHDQLRELAIPLDTDIIAITETKLKANISNATVFPNDYEVIRKDRVSKGGGGVALLVKNRLRMEEINTEVESDFQEYLTVKVVTGNISILIALIYNPPRSNDMAELYDTSNQGTIEVIKSVSQLAASKGYRLLILGDFNHKDINWLELNPHGESGSWRAKFLNCIQENFLHQHVLEPTRARGDDTPSTLDLVFTHSSLDIENLEYRAPLGRSDHCILSMNFIVEDIIPKKSSEKDRRFNYPKGDYMGLNEFLSNVDWITSTDRESEVDVDEVISIFLEKYKEGTEVFVPMTKIGRKGGIQKWFNKECQMARKERDSFWKHYRKRGTWEARERYKLARNKYLLIRRTTEKQYEQDMASKAKDNSKLFHSFIRGKLKVKEQVIRLVREDGSITTTDAEICREFNETFQTSFTTETTSPPEISTSLNLNRMLSNITILEKEVSETLKELDPHSAAGPDGVAAYVLVQCADQLSKPLTFLFNLSLQTEKLPSIWKTGDIIPIFKNKGSRNCASNYRPVSLTSILCKVMEKIVRRKISEHLEDIKFLVQGQHGFREGRSTLTNLLEFYDCVSNILQERNGWADCVYLDFQKAFDSVPHGRLLAKIEKQAGISGKVLSWIGDFLRDRKQRVKVRGAVSDLGPVTSGVPQGSVLGPLLFLIYINDLPGGISSIMNMFADDGKLLKKIVNLDSCKELQDDLNKLQEWSNKWLMNFNTSKCKVMHMGKSKFRPKYEYTLNGKILQVSDKERDLGVNITPDLSPDQHITSICKSAYALLANIRIAFRHLDLNSFRNIYLTYVRPKLEYAAPLWNPHKKKDIHKLERVQRHATRMVPELRDLSYKDRLERLAIPSLQSRRLRGDMITVYKLLNGFDKVDSTQFFKKVESKTRGHPMKIEKKAAKRDVRKFFFSIRVTDKWNSLQETVVEAKSIHSFKARYDRLQL